MCVSEWWMKQCGYFMKWHLKECICQPTSSPFSMNIGTCVCVCVFMHVCVTVNYSYRQCPSLQLIISFTPNNVQMTFHCTIKQGVHGDGKGVQQYTHKRYTHIVYVCYKEKHKKYLHIKTAVNIFRPNIYIFSFNFISVFYHEICCFVYV